MSWNLIPIDDSEYELANGTNTIVRVSKRFKPDLTGMMSLLEESGFPIEYSRGVILIYFMMMKGDAGRYVQSAIGVSHGSLPQMTRTLIHEIGHHVDANEGISEDPKIISEKSKRARYLSDAYARKDVGEYVAVGFETYYFGGTAEKERMKRLNPQLYDRIAKIHNQYTTTTCRKRRANKCHQSKN